MILFIESSLTEYICVTEFRRHEYKKKKRKKKELNPDMYNLKLTMITTEELKRHRRRTPARRQDQLAPVALSGSCFINTADRQIQCSEHGRPVVKSRRCVARPVPAIYAYRENSYRYIPTWGFSRTILYAFINVLAISFLFRECCLVQHTRHVP